MRALLLSLCLAIALAPAARGEEASIWLDRMEVFYERVDFSADFALTGTVLGMVLTGTGEAVYVDERRQRMSARIGMGLPGYADAFSGSFVEVRDGTYLWSEMAVGQMAEVTKERLDKEPGSGLDEPGQTLNPIAGIRAIQSYATFESVEITDAKVLLRGRLLSHVEDSAKSDLLGSQAQISEIVLGLRRRDAAPLMVSIGPPGGPPIATLQMENVERLPSDQSSGVFAYTPPPGVDVVEK